jgi:hypothetical protein
VAHIPDQSQDTFLSHPHTCKLPGQTKTGIHIYWIAEKKFHNTLNMTIMSGPDKPNNHAKNDHGNNLVSVTHKVWDNHVPHELQ